MFQNFITNEVSNVIITTAAATTAAATTAAMMMMMIIITIIIIIIIIINALKQYVNNSNCLQTCKTQAEMLTGRIT